MNIRSAIAAFALAASGLTANGVAATAADPQPAADLIVRHARIWTLNPAQPQAEGVAVLNGRIVAVGSDAAVLKWRGPHTRTVDAQGKRLLPGFNDSHVHFLSGGRTLGDVDLAGLTTLEQVQDAISKFAASKPELRVKRAGDDLFPSVLP